MAAVNRKELFAFGLSSGSKGEVEVELTTNPPPHLSFSLYLADGTMNEKEKQQIVAEVNILRELRHPYIVRYYDRIIDKRATKLYIVMEWCQGGDLAQVIRKHAKERTRAEESFVWKVLGQVVSALKSCHRHTENGQSKPILHRDLKPANILLDKNMNAKLCDFGLATELAGTNKLAMTTGVGTPYYMSPELVNNQRYDERSDIWSVGCIIYELAALRPPFDAANQLALAVKINAGQFKRLPSNYSDELERTCGWMLRRDISRRPKVEDLERLPNLVLPLREARLGLKEIDIANAQAKITRDQKQMEEEWRKREEVLSRKEAELKVWEERLNARMQEMDRREGGIGGGVGSERSSGRSERSGVEAPFGLPPPPPTAIGNNAMCNNNMMYAIERGVASTTRSQKKRSSAGFRIPLVSEETENSHARTTTTATAGADGMGGMSGKTRMYCNTNNNGNGNGGNLVNNENVNVSHAVCGGGGAADKAKDFETYAKRRRVHAEQQQQQQQQVNM
jgi:NIMA (never in mitosis gene a)-related kinase